GWEKPTWGVFELPRGDHVTEGRVFNEQRKWLSGMMDILRPDLVIFESPMLAGNVPITAAYLLIGMAAITEELCSDRGIDVAQAAVSTVRKHFVGHGRAKKDDVGWKCRQLGWQVSDHNA